jgi:hypothetical protein
MRRRESPTEPKRSVGAAASKGRASERIESEPRYSILFAEDEARLRRRRVESDDPRARFVISAIVFFILFAVLLFLSKLFA